MPIDENVKQALQDGLLVVTELGSDAERRAQQAQDLTAFDGINLLGIKRQVADILQLIGRNGMFAAYTKHDVTHLDSMLSLLEWLVPPSTARVMSPGDWLTVVLSIYFHDLGMVVTDEEFESRDRSRLTEFAETHLYSRAEGADYRARVMELPPAERERFIYQEYVRHHHPMRIAKWIQGVDVPGTPSKVALEVSELLKPLHPQYRRDLAWLCESHHLYDLSDFSKYRVAQPYGRQVGETVNLHYAAILLRTSDLLHMTSDRTPSVMFRLINPSDPISQEQWARQLAVTSVRPKPGETDGAVDANAPRDTVEVHAFFESPNGFFGLTSYIAYVREELRQVGVWAALAISKQGVKHEFPWKHIDDSQIETQGFLRQTFSFTIDQARILDLLTGHTLYNDPDVALRELVQNSIDAVRASHVEHKEPGYAGEVLIEWNSASRTLTVTDNGTGMSQATIENNLLRVGASRYQQDDFRKAHPDFYPISRFGIGILSTFMLADAVEIITSSPEEDKGRRLELRSVHGKYLISLLDKDAAELPFATHGTRVTLRVRPSAQITKIREIAKRWIVVPGCTVRLVVDGAPPETVGYTTVGDALTDELESIGLRVHHPGDGQVLNGAIEVRTRRRGSVELAYAVEWNEYFREWSFVTFRARDDDEDTPLFGTCVEGIRVEFGSPGFDGVGIAAMANATGRGAPRTNVARTGIEASEERSNLLRDIYATLSSHVSEELSALHRARGFSLTWALHEAMYLLRTVDHSSDELPGATDPRALFSEVFQIECLAIETEGARAAASPAAVASLPEFWTIDGQLFRSAESLMREVGGATSLAALVGTMAGQTTLIPDGAILCAFGEYKLASDAATSGKEIGRIHANVNDRTVELLWRPRGTPPRWATHQPLRGERYVSRVIGRRLPNRPVTFATQPIELQGLDMFSKVRAFNRLYVLYSERAARILADILARESKDEPFRALSSVLWDVLGRDVADVSPSAMSDRIEAQYQRSAAADGRRRPSISDLYDITEFSELITQPNWRTFDVSAWVRSENPTGVDL